MWKPVQMDEVKPEAEGAACMGNNGNILMRKSLLKTYDLDYHICRLSKKLCSGKGNSIALIRLISRP